MFLRSTQHLSFGGGERVPLFCFRGLAFTTYKECRVSHRGLLCLLLIGHQGREAAVRTGRVVWLLSSLVFSDRLPLNTGRTTSRYGPVGGSSLALSSGVLGHWYLPGARKREMGFLSASIKAVGIAASWGYKALFLQASHVLCAFQDLQFTLPVLGAVTLHLLVD